MIINLKFSLYERNERRRQQFLDKKLLPSYRTEKHDIANMSSEVSAKEPEPTKQTENVLAENGCQCAICEYKAENVYGLNIHMRKKHKNIEQLDGNSEERSVDGSNDTFKAKDADEDKAKLSKKKKIAGSHPCGVCDFCGKRVWNVIEHTRMMH